MRFHRNFGPVGFQLEGSSIQSQISIATRDYNEVRFSAYPILFAKRAPPWHIRLFLMGEEKRSLGSTHSLKKSSNGLR